MKGEGVLCPSRPLFFLFFFGARGPPPLVSGAFFFI